MTGLLALLLALAGGPPPTYLAERVVFAGGETRRVSLFRDGTVVLAWSRPGKDKLVRTRRLLPSELDVLRQVVSESYAQLGAQAGVSQGVGSAQVELRVAPVGCDPLIVRYPLASATMLATVRLGRALDELETVLMSGGPVREDLRGWEPQVGDCVELEDGRIVSIVEIVGASSGSIYRLRVGESPASVYVPEEELRRRAVRRVKP
jgi:hypothetical protein